MIYVLNTEINSAIPLSIALTNIYGIGYIKSKKICKNLGFSIYFKTKYLSPKNIRNILKTIDNLGYVINTDLKKQKNLQMLKLINIKSFKGLRKLRGLPVRGDRKSVV